MPAQIVVCIRPNAHLNIADQQNSGQDERAKKFAPARIKRSDDRIEQIYRGGSPEWNRSRASEAVK